MMAKAGFVARPFQPEQARVISTETAEEMVQIFSYIFRKTPESQFSETN